MGDEEKETCRGIREAKSVAKARRAVWGNRRGRREKDGGDSTRQGLKWSLGVGVLGPWGGVDVSDLVRVTVSLEGDLLDNFDRYWRDGKFPTRSEAIGHVHPSPRTEN